MITMLPRDDNGLLESYAWPGGYALVYYTVDGGTLCPDCARMAEAEGLTAIDDPQWTLGAASVQWEGPTTVCDHCGKELPTEYGDPDSEN